LTFIKYTSNHHVVPLLRAKTSSPVIDATSEPDDALLADINQ